jgi:hypothetical protein
MSNSSLSLPPMSEPSLPILPPAPPSPQPQGLYPLQLRRTASQLRLPKSDSLLFTAGLFCRTLLETMPPTVQLRCMQPGCKYSPKPQPLDHSITSNYWTHYKNVHPEIAMLYNQNAPQSLRPCSPFQRRHRWLSTEVPLSKRRTLNQRYVRWLRAPLRFQRYRWLFVWWWIKLSFSQFDQNQQPSRWLCHYPQL